MNVQTRLKTRRTRRTFRVRNGLRRASTGRLRLTVFRSNKHMYAQIIDDLAGETVVAASTLDKELFGPGKIAGNREAATKVGQLLAKRALDKGIKQVSFDRGGYKFHGRVAALAAAARESGLDF
jgi:large subunit ribosomal protein L18